MQCGDLVAGSAAENGHAGDKSPYGLHDLATARAAMADGGEEAASQPDNDDEDDELFKVHASARGADAGAPEEAEAAAVPGPDDSAAPPTSGTLNLSPWLGRAQSTGPC